MIQWLFLTEIILNSCFPAGRGTGRVITGGQPSILCNDTGHTGPGPGSVITRHTDFRPRATGALSPI